MKLSPNMNAYWRKSNHISKTITKDKSNKFEKKMSKSLKNYKKSTLSNKTKKTKKSLTSKSNTYDCLINTKRPYKKLIVISHSYLTFNQPYHKKNNKIKSNSNSSNLSSKTVKSKLNLFVKLNRDWFLKINNTFKKIKSLLGRSSKYKWSTINNLKSTKKSHKKKSLKSFKNPNNKYLS